MTLENFKEPTKKLLLKDFDDLISKMKQYCLQNMNHGHSVCFSYRDLLNKLRDLSTSYSDPIIENAYHFISGFIAALSGVDFINDMEEALLMDELDDLYNYASKKCISSIVEESVKHALSDAGK